MGNYPYSILKIFGKWEETLTTPFGAFLENGRKLSLPILTIFEKWEEIVPTHSDHI
jgi:hypothetical protein